MKSLFGYPFIFLMFFGNKGFGQSHCDAGYCPVEHLKVGYDYIFDSESSALGDLGDEVDDVGLELESGSPSWNDASNPPRSPDGSKDCRDSKHANMKVKIKATGEVLSETIALLKVQGCDDGRLEWVYAWVDNHDVLDDDYR